eukprot:CAMPEP_0181288256 /NCGR_PEP_ID=MMETSP1101-20121128/235_1 /TAXON_ID=46948 /ORGANISM="Rhodomonas abbreviata, Strain Caron Lab Isolate" /LENGTH=120 /DNA_ID=CAMNT_0023392365 /DNA_START=160 /DNA_END=522 /DNA_ORIENTATION=-
MPVMQTTMRLSLGFFAVFLALASASPASLSSKQHSLSSMPLRSSPLMQRHMPAWNVLDLKLPFGEKEPAEQQKEGVSAAFVNSAELTEGGRNARKSEHYQQQFALFLGATVLGASMLLPN